MKYLKSIPFLTLAWTAQANAAMTINVFQSEGNVIAVASGIVNTARLGPGQDGGTWGAGVWGSFINSSLIVVNTTNGSSYNYHEGVSGPAYFGSGDRFLADSGSGTMFGIRGNTVYLPKNYVSGSPLSSTSTWNSQTVAGLGLTPGSYTYTWGSGSNADSATLNISAVPEPTSIVLTMLASGVMLIRRKR